MAWTSRSWALGVVILVTGCVGTGRDALASPAERLTVSLLVVDQAGVPPDVLSHAEAEATKIYDKLGVKLVWAGGTANVSSYQLVVKIVAVPLPAKEADPRALGVAPGTRTVRGTLAYAFNSRIQDFATTHRIDPGVILGHVIAHELGHLLLPYNSHSKTGIMSGAWDQQQALCASKGALAFGADEARLIRAGLAARRN